MKRGKTTFSKEFKEEVLEFYKKAGPKAASEVFGVDKSLLLAWRRKLGVTKFNNSNNTSGKTLGSNLGDKKSRRQYSKEFKLEVLAFFKENGEKATVSKFDINSNLLYTWSKAHSDGNLKASNRFLKAKDEDVTKEDDDDPLKLLEKIEPFKNYSDEEKREVLNYYCDHGKEATLNQYGMTPHRLYNWIKKFQHEFAEKLPAKRRKTKVEMEFIREVLEHAESFGIKAASERYGVLISTIWDWKSKTKMKAGKSPMGHKKVLTEEKVKKEIVEYYLENGAFSCEKKFQVPRQTVRNWALKTEGVKIPNSSSQMKLGVVKDAKEAGVKKTLEKYSVSRATLYNWSKLSDVSVTENQAEESIAVELKKEDEVRRIVFYKKKPAVVKVPKEKISKKSKRKKEIVDVQPHNSSELPDWAKEFIRKNVPKVDNSVVLPENEILFTNDMFTMSTGKILSAEEEMLTDTVDVQNSAMQDQLNAVEVEVNLKYHYQHCDLLIYTLLPSGCVRS